MERINYKEYKILLVDDEKEYLENMLMELRDEFEITTAQAGLEAHNILKNDSIKKYAEDHGRKPVGESVPPEGWGHSVRTFKL